MRKFQVTINHWKAGWDEWKFFEPGYYNYVKEVDALDFHMAYAWAVAMLQKMSNREFPPTILEIKEI